MAQHIVSTEWNGDGCYHGVKVDDANELLDLGLGQYMLDFTPDTIYYVPAGCGAKCTDDNGKDWTNCSGFAGTVQQISKNKGFIIAFIILLIGVVAYWYFKKK